MAQDTEHIGISIVFFCHDGSGNFLMAKRSQNSRDEHGRWDIGGGKLEFGHSVEATLKKEIKEEYCTKIINHQFLGYRDVHRRLKGQKTHWIALHFKVLVNKSQVKNGEPHKFNQIGWFTLDKLPSPLHSQLPGFFEKFKHQL